MSAMVRSHNVKKYKQDGRSQTEPQFTNIKPSENTGHGNNNVKITGVFLPQ